MVADARCAMIAALPEGNRDGAHQGKIMYVQSVSIGSMFGWIGDTFTLFKQHLSGFLVAAGVTLLLFVLIFLPMWLVMLAAMPGPLGAGGTAGGGLPMAGHLGWFYSMYGFSIVLSLALFPPLLIGWFRLCRDLDQGTPVSGMNILKPYRDRPLWLRSLGFALLAFVIYVAVLALCVLAFWAPIAALMQQAALQQAAALTGATPVPPAFSAGLVLGYFTILAVAVLFQFFYMLGFAEISLRPTTVAEAMKQAATGVLKNALKLLVFLVGSFFLLVIVFLIIGLILGLLAAVLAMISPKLMMVGIFLLYVPIALCMYPLMFAGHYFVWKSVLGGGPEPLPEITATAVAA